MDELRDAMAEMEAAEAPEALEAPVEAVEPEPEVSDDDLDLGDLMERVSADQERGASAVAAPEHWSPEDKDFLASLPSDAARERALSWRTSLEKGYQTKFEALAETRRLGEELEQTFTPLGISRQQQGEAIRRLVAAEQALRTDPINAVAALVGGAGMAGTQQAEAFIRSLASALGVNAGGASQAPRTPEQARLEAIERQIAQREQLERQQQQQRLHAVTSAAQTKLREFAEATDASGQALRPHFGAVKATMGSLIQAAAASGRELSLEQAYEQAVWAVPELRADLQKAEQARAAQAAAEAQRAAVAKAKGARTPKTASARVPTVADDADLETMLSSAYDEHMAA